MLHACAQQHGPQFHVSEARSRRMTIGRRQYVDVDNGAHQLTHGSRLIQEGFEEEVSVPLARMEYGTVGQSYVLLKREAGSMTMGKLGACLQFTVKEIDPSTGERGQAPMHPLARQILMILRLPPPAQCIIVWAGSDFACPPQA